MNVAPDLDCPLWLHTSKVAALPRGGNIGDRQLNGLSICLGEWLVNEYIRPILKTLILNQSEMPNFPCNMGAWEKSLEILSRSWKVNPGRGEGRQWAIPLSFHDWLKSNTDSSILIFRIQLTF